MARLVALEWDAKEARVAVASPRGEGIVLEQAFEVPFEPREEGQSDDDRTAEIGNRLATALTERRIGRGEALVAIARAAIELKQLTLPPAPDDELPDLVRFQAMRDFHSLGEAWPLDYVPLGSNPAEPRQVLAVALSPELLAQIRATCQRAGLEVGHLVLRPYAAASLFLRRAATSEYRVRLLVDILGEEADLTAMVGDTVVFLRTARLPAGLLAAPENCQPLLSEIRRTMAAVTNQLGGQKVEAVYLCGSQATHQTLCDRIGKELGLPAQLFDPLAGVELGRELRKNPIDNTGRFTPLVGMLLDEAAGGRHTLDFLHPRRRPAPPSHRRQFAWAGAIAATLVLAVTGWVWFSFYALDQEIGDLERQLAAKQAEAKKMAEYVRQAGEIERWTQHDIAWLDELAELSRELPPALDVKLTQFRLGATREGGRIDFEGLVRSATTVDTLENALRDAHHRVEGQSRQMDEKQAPYSWRFSSAITVMPQATEDYRRRLSAAKEEASESKEQPRARVAER
jgi:Tfp pilus assembly PilM family ATPase